MQIAISVLFRREQILLSQSIRNTLNVPLKCKTLFKSELFGHHEVWMQIHNHASLLIVA